MEWIGISAGARANGPGIGDVDVKDTGANRLAAGGGLIRKVDIRAQDFRGFLPKLESISQLILYKNFDLFHILLSLLLSTL